MLCKCQMSVMVFSVPTIIECLTEFFVKLLFYTYTYEIIYEDEDRPFPLLVLITFFRFSKQVFILLD